MGPRDSKSPVAGSPKSEPQNNEITTWGRAQTLPTRGRHRARVPSDTRAPHQRCYVAWGERSWTGCIHQRFCNLFVFYCASVPIELILFLNQYFFSIRIQYTCFFGWNNKTTAVYLGNQQYWQSHSILNCFSLGNAFWISSLSDFWAAILYFGLSVTLYIIKNSSSKCTIDLLNPLVKHLKILRYTYV